MSDAQLEDDGSVRYDGVGGEHRWPSLAALATDYWAYQRLSRRARARSDQAAWGCVGELMVEPSARWADVLQALVDSASNEDDLVMVGAHPMEELIVFNHHAEQVIDEVETRARRDSRFRQALSAVWLNDEDVSPEIATRLRRFGVR